MFVMPFQSVLYKRSITYINCLNFMASRQILFKNVENLTCHTINNKRSDDIYREYL